MGFERALTPDDPKRCTGPSETGDGRCPYLSEEGCTVCQRHGAHKQLKSQNRENIRRLRTTIWQNRLNELADPTKVEVYNLTEEIGVLRLLLEETMNSCKNATDLVVKSSSLNNTVLNLQKLVSAAAHLDIKLGTMMHKDRLFAIMDQLVQIIGKYVIDPEESIQLAEEISTVFNSTSV